MKVVLISDTHCHKPELPEGDLLIHAGDLTLEGNGTETAAALEWLGWEARKYRWVVLIAGNHDWWFYKAGKTWARQYCREAGANNIHYLQDEWTTLGGLSIYGSPWQPEFCDWAFNVKRGPDIKRYWDQIPSGLDILVTHGPPMGILDRSSAKGSSVGCADLRVAVERTRPKMHVFGHIHGGRGAVETADTEFYNASMVDEAYRQVHRAWEIEL